ncbi:MAG: formylglycine-generating enzyme family protein [Chitinispirillales bacterium]|nr:formylglycine-generating enzyme family protein [Chitinispirillales bacterium]
MAAIKPRPLSAVAEHERQSVAVYMAGEERREILGAYKILGGELARAIGESDKYLAVNRTDAILGVLGKEHIYQRSGAVMDEQIKDLGKQFGAQYICIAEVSEVKGGTYYLDVRLIDVVTAKTVSSATAGSNLADINEMIRVAQELADALIGAKGAARGAVSRQKSDGGAAPKPVITSGAPAIAEFTDPKTGMEMVFVRGGTFTMGCSAEQGNCQEHEKPAHRVTVSDFYISKYTVTQKQWEKVMGTNPSMIKGDFAAVEGITWDDAQEYLSRVKASTGRVYRLPTEAEWEYAARGGEKGKGYKFAGSDNINDVGWYSGNTPHLAVRKVGAKAPNELGLYDMCGNVFEWAQDWFAVYPSRSQTDPLGPATGSYRILRGGSYFLDAPFCRVHTRLFIMPDMDPYPSIGLRLAMSPSNVEKIKNDIAPGGKATKEDKVDRGNGNKVNIDMVFVKGGTFKMGCAKDADSLCSGNGEENPAHDVTLGDFYISKYPITQKLWHDVMGITVRQQRDNMFMNSKEPLNGEGDDFPMYYVTYNHVKDFISALNAMTGKRYRLPTEAEWEYAARGGVKSSGYAFAGSDRINDAGWHFGNSGDKLLRTDKDFGKMKDKDKNMMMSWNNHRLRPVGAKMPNELGVYDMSGGVMEWVSDFYDSEYYKVSPKGNPKGPVLDADEMERADRVVRGGSWREAAAKCRVSSRRYYPPILGGIDIGFRLVLPAEK